MTISNAHAIAVDFASRLKAELSEADFSDMMEANAAEARCSVCHSHDYCDANEVMAEAFAAIMGRPALGDDGMTDEDAALWNEAWSIAKSLHLTSAIIYDRNGLVCAGSVTGMAATVGAKPELLAAIILRGGLYYTTFGGLNVLVYSHPKYEDGFGAEADRYVGGDD